MSAFGHGGQADLAYLAFGALLACRVKDGLFTGNAASSRDEEFIESNKITHVINCAGTEVPNFFSSRGIAYLTFQWKDAPQSVVLDAQDQNIDQIFLFVERAISRGESVLVHSLWSLESAMSFMTTMNPEMKIKPYFMKQLLSFHSRNGVSEDIFDPTIDLRAMAIDNENLLLRNTFLNSISRGDEMPGQPHHSHHASPPHLAHKKGSRRLRWNETLTNDQPMAPRGPKGGPRIVRGILSTAHPKAGSAQLVSSSHQQQQMQQQHHVNSSHSSVSIVPPLHLAEAAAASSQNSKPMSSSASARPSPSSSSTPSQSPHVHPSPVASSAASSDIVQRFLASGGMQGKPVIAMSSNNNNGVPPGSSLSLSGIGSSSLLSASSNGGSYAAIHKQQQLQQQQQQQMHQQQFHQQLQGSISAVSMSMDSAAALSGSRGAAARLSLEQMIPEMSDQLHVSSSSSSQSKQAGNASSSAVAGSRPAPRPSSAQRRASLEGNNNDPSKKPPSPKLGPSSSPIPLSSSEPIKTTRLTHPPPSQAARRLSAGGNSSSASGPMISRSMAPASLSIRDPSPMHSASSSGSSSYSQQQQQQRQGVSAQSYELARQVITQYQQEQALAASSDPQQGTPGRGQTPSPRTQQLLSSAQQRAAIGTVSAMVAAKGSAAAAAAGFSSVSGLPLSGAAPVISAGANRPGSAKPMPASSYLSLQQQQQVASSLHLSNSVSGSQAGLAAAVAATQLDAASSLAASAMSRQAKPPAPTSKSSSSSALSASRVRKNGPPSPSSSMGSLSGAGSGSHPPSPVASSGLPSPSSLSSLAGRASLSALDSAKAGSASSSSSSVTKKKVTKKRTSVTKDEVNDITSRLYRPTISFLSKSKGEAGSTKGKDSPQQPSSPLVAGSSYISQPSMPSSLVSASMSSMGGLQQFRR